MAFRVIGRLNKYLMAGSHLPDLVPFVPNSVFTFEEIHESPEKMLRFLEKKYPHARDLALGMMGHSAKYGADKFNREIEEWLLGGKKKLRCELLEDIVDWLSVDLKLAPDFMHGVLWHGVDAHLLKSKQGVVKRIAEAHREIGQEEIALFLAECFGKRKKEVQRMVEFHLGPISPERLVSIEGLVEISQSHLAGLPGRVVFDEKEAVRLSKKVYDLFKDGWGEILEKVVTDVEKRMKFFLGTSDLPKGQASSKLRKTPFVQRPWIFPRS